MSFHARTSRFARTNQVLRCCHGLSCIAGAHDRRSRMRRRLDALRACATSASAATWAYWRCAANASHLHARVTTTPVVSCAISKRHSIVRSIRSGALIVSDSWLELLVTDLTARPLPFYAALTYNGQITFDPFNRLECGDHRGRWQLSPSR
jgi:hypothetical protein